MHREQVPTSRVVIEICPLLLVVSALAYLLICYMNGHMLGILLTASRVAILSALTIVGPQQALSHALHWHRQLIILEVNFMLLNKSDCGATTTDSMNIGGGGKGDWERRSNNSNSIE
jgi:hypothetical protein